MPLPHETKAGLFRVGGGWSLESGDGRSEKRIGPPLYLSIRPESSPSGGLSASRRRWRPPRRRWPRSRSSARPCRRGSPGTTRSDWRCWRRPLQRIGWWSCSASSWRRRKTVRQKPRASAGGYSVAAYPQSFGGDQLAFAPVRPALGEAGRARKTLLRTDWSRS
jgi:hypothetical protein